MDKFEEHLRSQPLNGPPPEWRSEILAMARQTGASVRSIEAVEHGRNERSLWLTTIRGWFWPHPGAWASLAAIWLFLFIMQHQMNVEIQEELTLAGVQPPITDVMLAMEQHQIVIEQLLALNDFEWPVIDRPKPMPVAPTNLPPLMLFTTRSN
jgi:hypothetical protein